MQLIFTPIPSPSSRLHTKVLVEQRFDRHRGLYTYKTIWNVTVLYPNIDSLDYEILICDSWFCLLICFLCLGVTCLTICIVNTTKYINDWKKHQLIHHWYCCQASSLFTYEPFICIHFLTIRLGCSWWRVLYFSPICVRHVFIMARESVTHQLLLTHL